MSTIPVPLPSFSVLLSTSSLPYPLTLLIPLFRLLAIACILPVILLASVDMVGWFFFKLILRPLGFASTIRFKDPEPSLLVVQASAGVVRPSAESSPTTSSRSSSAGSSPAISYKALPNDGLGESSNLGSPTFSSSVASKFPSLFRRRRSASSSTNVSMDAARASVGVEGPLFNEDDGGLLSPSRSDDLELASDRESTAESSRSEDTIEWPKGGIKFGMSKRVGNASMS